MRRRFVPCKDQGHRFVAKLLVGHAPLLVFDEHHVREQISAVFLVGQPFVMHAPDDFFDFRDGAFLPPVLGGRPPVGPRNHLVGVGDQDFADVS